MEISVKDYMERQPGSPKVCETDQFYLWIALRLAKLWDESPWLRDLDDDVKRDVVLAVTGYYQDVVADGGVWRSFSRLHSTRNGGPVPHYAAGEGYVDFELNEEDVRFVMWWTIAGEEGPDAQFCIASEVDLDNPQDAQRIYDYAYWLYWRSFLLRPSSMAVMQRSMPQAHAIIARAGESDARPLLLELNERLMSTEPAGPIPLTTAQWLRLIVNDELP